MKSKSTRTERSLEAFTCAVCVVIDRPSTFDIFSLVYFGMLDRIWKNARIQ